MTYIGEIRMFIDGKEAKGLGVMEWAAGMADQQLERAKRDTAAETFAGISGDLAVTMEWHGKMNDAAMRDYCFKLLMNHGSRFPRGMQKKRHAHKKRKPATVAVRCSYQYGTIECRGDGYCWDADWDGYDPNDHSWPCPACNTATYLKSAKEEAESTLSYRDISGAGDGVTIWESAVAVARRENPAHVDEILNEIGRVDALFEGDSDDEDGDVKTFIYPEQAKDQEQTA